MDVTAQDIEGAKGATGLNIAKALASAHEQLLKAGITDPRREAGSLLVHALGRPPAFLIAHPEYHLSEQETERFLEAVSRRERREPFQYITGKQEFWNLEFDVAPGVLIPRPETEILVEAAIELLGPLPGPHFAEAGVGSGCISISILHSIPGAAGVATDLSDDALKLAAANALKFGVDGRLSLRKADLFAGISGGNDLAVSNPPYIPQGDLSGLQPEVADFEPHTALFGGVDGLDVMRRIIKDARHILSSGGVLMMEIGAGQAAAVTGLFDGEVWETPHFKKDLQSIPRVVIASLK